ncbi:17318_t:CDS:1 [Acaulospora colombiana]|uniref:17318_t:CDS:1 n=1 Tax=Acaulospora colombiana TaxID=27376 RepID=A0ACA9L447_9GLOM|nr:17318_t:CDS:1 [Acaulospora colombiana]
MFKRVNAAKTVTTSLLPLNANTCGNIVSNDFLTAQQLQQQRQNTMFGSTLQPAPQMMHPPLTSNHIQQTPMQQSPNLFPSQLHPLQIPAQQLHAQSSQRDVTLNIGNPSGVCNLGGMTSGTTSVGGAYPSKLQRI